MNKTSVTITMETNNQFVRYFDINDNCAPQYLLCKQIAKLIKEFDASNKPIDNETLWQLVQDEMNKE